MNRLIITSRGIPQVADAASRPGVIAQPREEWARALIARLQARLTYTVSVSRGLPSLGLENQPPLFREIQHEIPQSERACSVK